jgi:hypothetical protein
MACGVPLRCSRALSGDGAALLAIERRQTASGTSHLRGGRLPCHFRAVHLPRRVVLIPLESLGVSRCWLRFFTLRRAQDDADARHLRAAFGDRKNLGCRHVVRSDGMSNGEERRRLLLRTGSTMLIALSCQAGYVQRRIAGRQPSAVFSSASRSVRNESPNLFERRMRACDGKSLCL